MRLLFAAILLASCAMAQTGRVAPKPLFRDPVYDGAADPAIVWDRANKKWMMFYTNRRASETSLPGVSWVHGTKIGVAESADDGASWRYTGTADIRYGRADYTYWAPEIVDHGGIYHMYLSVVPGIYNDWNATREIIHLTSLDLRQWKFEAKLDLGSDKVIDACVLRLPDGSFRMWYKNERAKDGSLYYADSPDLYRWTSRGNSIKGVAGEGPKAFRWKDHYWMVVDVWNGLGVFKSEDAVTWVRQPDNLLKEPGRLPSDRGKGQHADVIVRDNRAWLFYFVHQGGPDGEGHPPEWQHRTVLQVVELGELDGQLECDRNRETRVFLSR